MVLLMAPTQRGKSRPHQAVKLLFETVDDFVEKLAKEEADKVAQGWPQKEWINFPRGTRANQKHVPAKFHNDRSLLQVQR